MSNSQEYDEFVINQNDIINIFEEDYIENTDNIERIGREQVKIIKGDEDNKEMMRLKKDEYLNLKNKEQVLLQETRNVMYKKNEYEDKKIFYNAIISIHIFIIIILLLGLLGTLHPVVVCLVIVIFYTMIVLIFYFKVRNDDKRNYFKYNKFDYEYQQNACKFNPGSNKEARERNQEESKKNERRMQEVRDLISENENKHK